jgi:hypothetical protein
MERFSAVIGSDTVYEATFLAGCSKGGRHIKG